MIAVKYDLYDQTNSSSAVTVGYDEISQKSCIIRFTVNSKSSSVDDDNQNNDK
jgi:hypothetical protein